MLTDREPTIPANSPYARLVEAFNLPYEENKFTSHCFMLSKSLGVRQSFFSDSLRRGGSLRAEIIQAAVEKGISETYLTTGQGPVYREGWKKAVTAPSLPVRN